MAMKDEDMEKIKKEALYMTYLGMLKFFKDYVPVLIYMVFLIICVLIMMYCLYEAAVNQSYIPSLIYLFIVGLALVCILYRSDTADEAVGLVFLIS
ncbi:hypothetical protein KFE26_23105, partial [Shewanella sp. M16]|uniref:hypothetical protein n=1 Tax=Shewanella sp. M16 TaxID=2830837 RepID=UPI001BAE5B3D